MTCSRDADYVIAKNLDIFEFPDLLSMHPVIIYAPYNRLHMVQLID